METQTKGMPLDMSSLVKIALELRKEGATVNEIAELFKIPVQSVKNILEVGKKMRFLEKIKN